jgi:thymidine kinase
MSRTEPIAPGDCPAQYDELRNRFRGASEVPGKIELMMGPMRSNKTAELLRRAEMRRQYAKQYVLVLKPSDDTKGGPGLVESRNPNGHARMQALEFNSANPWPVLANIAEIEQEIGKRVECVAIDEGQFVGELFLFARNLLDANHDVLVAGLDLDFRALPFGEMLNLSWLVNAYGGSITECMAYCTCGARALSRRTTARSRCRAMPTSLAAPSISSFPDVRTSM